MSPPQLAERVVPRHRRPRSRSTPGTAARPGTRSSSAWTARARQRHAVRADRRVAARAAAPRLPVRAEQRACARARSSAPSASRTPPGARRRCPGRPCRPAGRRRSGGRRPGGSAPRTAGRRPRGGSRTPCGARRRARASVDHTRRRPSPSQISILPSQPHRPRAVPRRAQLRLEAPRSPGAPARSTSPSSSSGVDRPAGSVMPPAAPTAHRALATLRPRSRPRAATRPARDERHRALDLAA